MIASTVISSGRTRLTAPCSMTPTSSASVGRRPQRAYEELAARARPWGGGCGVAAAGRSAITHLAAQPERASARTTRCPPIDRKSTRLNSSHSQISYAVFCLKKKIETNLNFKKHEIKDL